MFKFAISFLILIFLNCNSNAESGRLTNLPGQPIIKSDTGPQSKIYLAPFNGNKKIINGVEREFTSSPLDATGPFVTLAGRTPGALYDMFTYWNGSAVQLCTTPMQTGSTVVPPPPSGGYVQLTGTPIGGMTSNGGLTAAFNNTVENYLTSSRSPGVLSGVSIDGSVGLSGLTDPITKFIAKTPSDNGFLGNNGSGTWQIRGSNSNFAASVIVTSGSFASSTGGQVLDISFTNTTVYSSIWFTIVGNGTNGTYLSELTMFKTDNGTSNPPVIGDRGIIYYSGRPVNAQTIACTADTGQLSCNQYACSYEGSIKLDDTTATVRCDLSYGEDRACPIWNVNNQKQICLQVGDDGPMVNGHYSYKPANTWGSTYGWGSMRGNSMLRMQIISGLPMQSILANYSQAFFMDSVNYSTPAYWFGIGKDTTTLPCGPWGQANFDYSQDQTGQKQNSECVIEPFVGMVTLNMIEGARQNGGVSVFWKRDNSVMTACFKQ